MNGQEEGLHVGWGGQMAHLDWDLSSSFSMARALSASRVRMRRRDDTRERRGGVQTNLLADGVAKGAVGVNLEGAPSVFRIAHARTVLGSEPEGTAYSPAATAALADLLSVWMAMPTFVPAFIWFFVPTLSRHVHGGSGVELVSKLTGTCIHYRCVVTLQILRVHTCTRLTTNEGDAGSEVLCSTCVRSHLIRLLFAHTGLFSLSLAGDSGPHGCTTHCSGDLPERNR